VTCVDENVTIPATIEDCTTTSIGSLSTPAASPRSEVSTMSEMTRQSTSIVTDDESLDDLVIVDDVQPNPSPGILSSAGATPVKRGSGRSRGRPRGSGVSLRSRGPGSIRQSLVAAEAAAATAAKTAAYAAYGYSFTGERSGTTSRADSPNLASIGRPPSVSTHTSAGVRQ
jgi:DNA helicase INO80